MRIKAKGPKSLLEVEASHIQAEAMPGAVTLHLKRNIGAERRAGHPMERMFIELALPEAREFYRDFGAAIEKAGAMGSISPGKDSAPLF